MLSEDENGVNKIPSVYTFSTSSSLKLMDFYDFPSPIFTKRILHDRSSCPWIYIGMCYTCGTTYIVHLQYTYTRRKVK